MRRDLLGALAVVAVLLGNITTAAAQTEFRAILSGANEVPAVTSSGFGMATLDVNFSRSVLGIDFKLSVFNITEAFMAHIHCGPAGQNGPVVAWLAGTPASPPNAGYDLNGTWASAKLTASGIVQGTGCGNTFTELLGAMASGQTYVNVHTRSRPDGEIRGQIMAVAPFTVP